MTTKVVLQEEIEIPFVRTLEEFRAWARSSVFPERGRIDYLAGRIEVNMSPEDLHTHGQVKTAIATRLGQIVGEQQLGELYIDRALFSSPAARLSTEPDSVFVSDAALDSGRVRLVPRATGEPDRFVELEGSADLIVEVVSDGSVKKDSRRLPKRYWKGGVQEFWLVDARGQDIFFRIHSRGPAGYQPAQVDPDGFQYSAVLAKWFRLLRWRNLSGRWRYDLEATPSANSLRG